VGRYDFTAIIDRRGTNSVKWDPKYLERLCGNPHAIPFWVADMDFRAPPEILQALHQRIDHGVFGYLSGGEEALEAFAQWTAQRYHWNIPAESVCFTPGIISGLSAAVNVFTDPGDKVIIQTPAYRPFFTLIRENNRKVLENPLAYEQNRFSIDFAHLEKMMSDPSASLMIFCSPHNPSGRVWPKEDLQEVSRLAQRYGVKIISDEIHADLTYPGYTHTPFSAVASHAVTCMAPSKTFNIPGEHFSCIVIPDEGDRKAYTGYLKALSIQTPSVLSFTAAAAAYRHGRAWLKELLELLTSHAELIDSVLRRRAPEITLVKPEASFIAFLDCRKVEEKLSPGKDLVSVLGEKGGIALHRGSWFGKAGRGFVRINFGTPTMLLEEGLSKLVRTIQSL